MKWVALAIVLVWLELSTTVLAKRALKREVKVDYRRSPLEYAILKRLIGNPKGNPITAKALIGERRTTRLHRLCSGKMALEDEWRKSSFIYDKIVCGMFTRRDEYKKHEDHVARLISGSTKEKTLEEQKRELIRAVNRMVKVAGPIPLLRFKGR